MLAKGAGAHAVRLAAGLAAAEPTGGAGTSGGLSPNALESCDLAHREGDSAALGLSRWYGRVVPTLPKPHCASPSGGEVYGAAELALLATGLPIAA